MVQPREEPSYTKRIAFHTDSQRIIRIHRGSAELSEVWVSLDEAVNNACFRGFYRLADIPDLNL